MHIFIHNFLRRLSTFPIGLIRIRNGTGSGKTRDIHKIHSPTAATSANINNYNSKGDDFMKFTCNTNELKKAISTAARASSTKGLKTILECILFTTENDSIRLNSFDTITAIETTIYAHIDESGETAIPAKLLSEIISKFPDGETTIERTEKGRIRISGGSASAYLTEMEADQFPAFNHIDGEVFKITEGELKKLVSGTQFAAYQGEDKPVFTGLLFEIEDGDLSVVAIDGFRMAKRRTNWNNAKPVKVIIPVRTLREITRLLSNDDDQVKITINESACVFEAENTMIYARLIEGEFLNYNNIIPKTFKTRVRVETRLFEKSLEMSSVLAKEDGNYLIKMKVNAGSLEISAMSEYGSIDDEIPVYTEGEVLNIAFNVKYMLDVLKVIEDDEIYMEFDSRLKPCIIRPVDSDKFMYMVVPVNVRN